MIGSMASYPYADSFIVAGAAVNGAVVTGYKFASTLSGIAPTYDQTPPNVPDAGPVTTATSFGAPGAFVIDFPTYEAYWVCVAYSGSYNWRFVPQASIAGANDTYEPQGGAAVSTVSPGNSTMLVSPTSGAVQITRPAITGDVGIPAGSNAATLATLGSALGPIGNTTTTPVVSIDVKGRVTALTTATIAFPVSATNTVTLTNKRNTPRTISVASSATPVIDTDNCDVAYISALAANVTSFTTSLTGTPQPWEKLIIAILDNGTARTITWGSAFEASSGVALPSTTVISTLLLVGFIYNPGTSKWRCVAVA
jgi:hypothetical protein